MELTIGVFPSTKDVFPIFVFCQVVGLVVPVLIEDSLRGLFIANVSNHIEEKVNGLGNIFNSPGWSV